MSLGMRVNPTAFIALVRSLTLAKLWSGLRGVWEPSVTIGPIEHDERSIRSPALAVIAVVSAVAVVAVFDRTLMLLGLVIPCAIGLGRLLVTVFGKVPRRSLVLRGREAQGLMAVLLVFAVFSVVQVINRGGLGTTGEAARQSIDVQLWARQNTPPNSLFLPVGLESFSIVSRRPIWADWKTGAMVMWAPETYQTWSTRWAELNGIESIAEALRLSEREGIDYIVVDHTRFDTSLVSSDCLVYENAMYSVIFAGDVPNPGETLLAMCHGMSPRR